jgi:hypothetical protein
MIRRALIRRALPTSLGALLVMVAPSGCGAGHDAALLTVTASVELPPIRHLVALVSGAGRAAQVTAPRGEGCPLSFPTTLSFVFPSDVDTLSVQVNGDDGAYLIASGSGSATVRHRDVTQLTVPLAPEPGVAFDGGTGCDAM